MGDRGRGAPGPPPATPPPSSAAAPSRRGQSGRGQPVPGLADRAGPARRHPAASVRGVARALGAELIVTLRWRGGELDRLADEGHAALVGAVMQVLQAAGWLVQPEVSYSIFGERGSIDIMAWHREERVLLVVEVKTDLTSIEETLRRHDAKVRLASEIARERFGWQARAVARLIVLPGSATARRRVRRHASILGRAYPDRARSVRRWLHRPTGAFSGLLFVAGIRGAKGSLGAVRRPRGGRSGSPSERVSGPSDGGRATA